MQVGPDLFAVVLSINIIIMVYVGGIGSIWGPVDARTTLNLAEKIYVLEHGRFAHQGTARELANDDEIRRVYLGI